MESFQTIIDVIIRTIAIFSCVIFYTRLMGLRSFSKISSFDFAMTIAVGSTISSGLLKSDLFVPSIVGLFILFFVQWLIASGRQKFGFISDNIDNTPTLLFRSGEFLENNLKAVNVTKRDIVAKMREHGVAKVRDVGAVIFETTENISIIKENDVDDFILENVRT